MQINTSASFNSTWAEIKAAVENGTVRELLHSGDQIPVTLKTGEKVIFDVAYDKPGKLFFVMHDCMEDEHEMNRKWTNAGGWPACDMRHYLNGAVFNLLPDDLQEAISITTIKQVIYGETITCEDKLFLLSKTQVFGKGSWTSLEPDDTHLDIFKTERDRVKLCGNNGTWFWWLRSPAASSASAFCYVNPNGSSASANATISYSVAFGFCI